MPKALVDHEMVNYDNALVVLGGLDPVWSPLIFKLTCSNRKFKWSFFTSQRFKIDRSNFVAMTIEDDFEN